MTRRADPTWGTFAYLAFLVLVIWIIFSFVPKAHGQERRRAINPSTVGRQTIRTSLSGPFAPIGDAKTILFFVHPNYHIRTGDNDESVGGFTPLPIYRVRSVESTVPGGPPRTFICRIVTFDVQSLEYDQTFKIDVAAISRVSPLLPTDHIAIQYRPWWNVSTSLDDAGVWCDACAWRAEMLAPVGGFAVPNGSCQ